MRKLAILSAILTFTAAGPLWAADVDGVSIHWTSHGSGTQAVIFVHGWTCDETSWQRQVPAISQKYRVITLICPDTAKADRPKTAASLWHFSLEPSKPFAAKQRLKGLCSPATAWEHR